MFGNRPVAGQVSAGCGVWDRAAQERGRPYKFTAVVPDLDRLELAMQVKITDMCPCVYPANPYSNKEWCCGDMPHLDMSAWAIEKVLLRDPSLVVTLRVATSRHKGLLKSLVEILAKTSAADACYRMLAALHAAHEEPPAF